MNKQKQTVKNNNKISGYFFLALRAGLPFIISTVIGLMTKLWWIGWFIYIPIHELLRPFVEYPFAKFLKFRKMPQKELFGKIPVSQKALVLLSENFVSKRSAEDFFTLAEMCAEKSGNIGFCLFFKGEKNDLTQGFIYNKITELNKKFGGGFACILKGKNAQDHILTVKRGAVTETVRYIKTGVHEFEEIFGDLSCFDGVKNLITVNETTKFDFGSIISLISAAAHPQNGVKLSDEGNTVIEGYGIISPMVICRFSNCSSAFFSRHYNRRNIKTSEDYLCKKIYMNAFDFGIFEGVGLIRTDAFYSCLNQKIPTEKIAAHTMVEGSFLRCGICFDSEMTEQFDGTVKEYFYRIKNLSREYFQNLFWLLPFINLGGKREKNPVVFLNKIFLSDRITHLLGPLMSLLTIVISPFVSFGTAFFVLSIFSVVSFGILDTFLLVFKNVGPLFTGKKREKDYNLTCSLPPCLFGLITLPQSAFFTLCGAAQGIFSRKVSKRRKTNVKMRDKSTLLWISRVVSFVFAAFIFLKFPLSGKIFAIFFAAGPLAAFFAGRGKTERRV